jgi:hypothetical protein
LVSGDYIDAKLMTMIKDGGGTAMAPPKRQSRFLLLGGLQLFINLLLVSGWGLLDVVK